MEFGRFAKTFTMFLFNKMELIVPVVLTSRFFRIRVDIVFKNTLCILYYCKLEGIVLKFIVLGLGSGQVAGFFVFCFFLY